MALRLISFMNYTHLFFIFECIKPLEVFWCRDKKAKVGDSVINMSWPVAAVGLIESDTKATLQKPPTRSHWSYWRPVRMFDGITTVKRRPKSWPLTKFWPQLDRLSFITIFTALFCKAPSEGRQTTKLKERERLQVGNLYLQPSSSHCGYVFSWYHFSDLSIRVTSVADVD